MGKPANISCENCAHFFIGMGVNEGKKCTLTNFKSLLGVDTKTHSCSNFVHKVKPIEKVPKVLQLTKEEIEEIFTTKGIKIVNEK